MKFDKTENEFLTKIDKLKIENLTNSLLLKRMEEDKKLTNNMTVKKEQADDMVEESYVACD